MGVIMMDEHRCPNMPDGVRILDRNPLCFKTNWRLEFFSYDDVRKNECWVSAFQVYYCPFCGKKLELEADEPLVKCRDCKHWLHDVPGCTEHVGICEWANWMCGENGFCFYGEKENER